MGYIFQDIYPGTQTNGGWFAQRGTRTRLLKMDEISDLPQVDYQCSQWAIRQMLLTTENFFRTRSVAKKRRRKK